MADIAVFKCELWLDDEIIATGWAEEIRGQGNVNKSSHVENAETSSLGRALANAGLSGSDFTKRPSREEMGKVVRYEGDMKITERADAPTEKQVWKLKSELKKVGKLPPSNLASMTKYEVSKAIDSLVNGDATPEPQDTPEDPF
jgi:deoxycytidylate deaminase